MAENVGKRLEQKESKQKKAKKPSRLTKGQKWLLAVAIVLAVVLVAVGLSCLISLWPVLSFISDGFRIILCAVAASALGAWLMPRPFEEEAADKQEAL